MTDRMEVTGEDGLTRYVVDANNVVFTPRMCRHRYDDADHCRFCGLTRMQIQQADDSHNQF